MARGVAGDRVGGLAAEMAFWGVLSIFPLTIAVAAGVGFLEPLVGAQASEDVRREVTDALRTGLPAEASGTVEAVENLFDRTRPGVFTVGLLVALWSASRGFRATVRALDLVYGLDDQRSWVEIRLLSLGLSVVTVLLGTVALLAFAVGPLLGGGAWLADVLGASAGFAEAWDVLRWPVAVGGAAAFLTTLYHLAPDHRTPWRRDLPGAGFALVSWALATVGLQLYARYGGSSNLLIGSLGGVLVVMVWLYLLAVGLLVGAELNAVLCERAGVVQVPRRDIDLAGLTRRLRRGPRATDGDA